MSIEILLTLGGVLLLLGLSAFFSGSETALTAASKARMHSLAEEGNRQAEVVNGLLASPSASLGRFCLATTSSTSLLPR